MKLLPLFICILLLGTVSAQTLKTFSKPGIPFVAKYPASWENKIKENNRVFFTSPLESEDDIFRQNVNIGVSYNKEFGTTLKVKDVIGDVLQELNKSITDFNMLADERYFKWNNVDACEISYTGVVQETNVKMVQWFAFSKGRLFTLTYSTVDGDDKYYNDAIKIMKGVVVK